jgi:hypothetical protein
MAECRTIIVPEDYILTDREIRVILELSERGKRAEVGADFALAWQRGEMTKKMLTLRRRDEPTHFSGAGLCGVSSDATVREPH